MHKFSVLLADIGGTNARFALWSGHPDHQPEHIVIYPTSQFSSLQIAIKTYLAEQKHPIPAVAALCLACPVHGDQVTMTNHAWSFSIEQVKKEMPFRDLMILNDFVAVAHAVPCLSSHELEVIQQGSSPTEAVPRLAIGLGTGLGAASVFQQNGVWQVYPSEAGHALLTVPPCFYPEVIETLFKDAPVLVNEQILSGPGLGRLYQAVCHACGHQAQALDSQAIVESAIAGQDTACLQTTKIFSHWFGFCTGSLVATLNAWGGVYIAGGVIRKMGQAFDRALFLQGFHLPGKLEKAWQQTPIYLVTQPYSAFVGLMNQLPPLLNTQVA